MTADIFVIDTETAGLGKPACEIGIIQLDRDLNVVKAYQSLLDPEVPIMASARAIHGIKDKDVADAPTLAQWSMMTPNPLLYSGVQNPWIVGHNVKFDTDTLGQEIPVPHRRSCTLRMARNLYPNLPDIGENHQLQTLMHYFDLDEDPFLKGEDGNVAHRAMFDVRCCVVFMRHLRQVELLSTQQILDEGCRPLSPETRLWFSKHKGTALKDLDLGFVAWLRRQPSMDEELLEALAFFPPTR